MIVAHDCRLICGWVYSARGLCSFGHFVAVVLICFYFKALRPTAFGIFLLEASSMSFSL